MKVKKTDENDKVYMMELSAPRAQIHLVFNLKDLMKLCETATVSEGDIIVLSPVKAVYCVVNPSNLPSIGALSLMSKPEDVDEKEIQAAWFASAPRIEDTKKFADAVNASLKMAGIKL